MSAISSLAWKALEMRASCYALCIFACCIVCKLRGQQRFYAYLISKTGRASSIIIIMLSWTILDILHNRVQAWSYD